MASLQDIINLAKADGGKFFVIDESGETKLVIMPVEEYQKLLLGKLQRQIVDVEGINRKILEAQLEEEKASEARFRGKRSFAAGINREITRARLLERDVLNQNNVPHVPVKENRLPRVDLRAEVIDPSFDFEAPKEDLDDL